MDDLRKALETIALRNSEGIIPDNILMRACEAYKSKSDDFLDDYDYHVFVSKSLSDHLHGEEPNEEICKALLPGQTKVVDGVVYVYTSTPGAKTKYDWRVLRGSTKSGRQVDDTKAVSKQKHVNELFPNDLSALKTIKKLGGSTGAELVEDSQGNQYVMKRGKNTSNEHVKSEYMANQLYDLLGLRVPDFELYDDGGDIVMLSKFIPITTVPTPQDYAEMSKGFAVDALLANWDVYQNDNCLIDSAGRVVRVDNGGALDYRAQGSKKNFGSQVLDWDSMMKYNPSVVSGLSPQDMINQLDELIKKRDDVVGFLVVSNEGSLVNVLDKRFKDLERIKNDLEAKIAKKNRKIKPRNLKPDSEMYKDFSEDEVNDFWQAQSGSDYQRKIHATNQKVGWELLSSICEERGFNGRPEVIDESDYWNIVKQSKYQMFRGLSSGGSHDAEYYSDDFKYNDNCFYGTMGVHGSGIYLHVNDGDKNKDNTQTTYKKSDAYNAALGYAGSSGEILECCLDPKAKVALVPDLKQEILSLVVFDKKLADEKQKEIDELNKDLNSALDDLHNITEKTEKKVKQDLNWDQDTLIMSQVEIDSTDWGRVDDEGNPDYPSFDEFVKKKMFDWVTKNGGKIKEKQPGSDVYSFSLPNSKETFMFSRFQYENSAIKRKNAFAKAYNYPVRRFQDWLMNNHYKVIQKAVEKELSTIGDKVTKAQHEVKNFQNELDTKHGELADLKKTKDPNSDMISGIYESVRNGSKEGIGTYAALKGYDAIVEPHGNGGPNSFMVVLNRSKVIVKK